MKKMVEKRSVTEVHIPSQAYVVIKVGSQHVYGDGSLLFDDVIYDGGRAVTKPYGALIRRVNFPTSSGKPEIVAYGNRIEGTLAAVKRMINARNIVLEEVYA